MRDELLERIEQVGKEAKSDATKLSTKIDAVKAELQAEISGVRVELGEMKAEMQKMQSTMHGMQASISRIEFLVEEQNTRNKIVLDAIAAMMGWKNQVDERLDDVERTVRSLAAARPVREPA